MTRLELLIDQIVSARRYTEELLDTIDPADWFRQPAGCPTHVAWQVGHLAMAEYRLALERIRGAQPDDEALIARAFLDRFGRGSVASADPASYPPPGEIRAVFDRVHGRALDELKALPDAQLDEPPANPHRLFATKLGALAWCSRHEMLHAGQIGLLRRMLGLAPVW